MLSEGGEVLVLLLDPKNEIYKQWDQSIDDEVKFALWNFEVILLLGSDSSHWSKKSKPGLIPIIEVIIIQTGMLDNRR